MSIYIVADEPAIKELVESNIYQSRSFEAGARLAAALFGNNEMEAISARIVPQWRKNVLYLLQSRVESGYLVIDGSVLTGFGISGDQDKDSDEVLLVFQRLCRFALKEWNGLGFSFSEIWSQKTRCGVVFPFPKSKHSGFRISIKVPEDDLRVNTRHGKKILFAFAAGTAEEAAADQDQERLYRKAFDGLGAARTSQEVEIKRIEKLPADHGYHPLVLTDPVSNKIHYQNFSSWLNRLTTNQLDFVMSEGKGPQRVEGPAGTGKTLSLLLRAIQLCRWAEENGDEFRIIFISHSEPTKNSIKIAFDAMGEPSYHNRDRTHFLQSVELYTLQEWCGGVLGSKEISGAQFLDQDALNAKELRKLTLIDIIESFRRDKTEFFDFLSESCREFFLKETTDYIAELLQHEIGVMIKGRAGEKLDAYLEMPALSYCLPVEIANDKRFVFRIYSEYQKQLNSSGVFDTDDIVLSTLGRLNTPIWRRRRDTEGYDAVIVDETHLFNFNELSLFHHLLKSESSPRIIFSIDRTQAPGERGITTKLVREVLTQASTEEEQTRTKVVFRSSPYIVRLAEAITASGAMLFTTFENPLLDVSSVISASDEDLAQECNYWGLTNDKIMCDFVIKRADEIRNRLKCPRSEVLIVAMSEDLLRPLKDALAEISIKFVEVVHRGDLDAVGRGARENAYIVSHPDYVGGLEFKVVLVVGVDEGRVPPTEGLVKDESRHFVEFKAFNRLYVAISRARLCVELFYAKDRGPSSLLKHAQETGAIVDQTGLA